MSIFKVNVKWQKQKFDDVEVDTSKPPIDFKAVLFSLSGVPPDRQKVMLQGSLLSDDSWHNIQLKNGMTIMMLGSAEKPPEAPVQTTRFIEDMDDTQMGKALEIPAGLDNLGNTCYMNATIQCLQSIPELKTAMKSMSRAPLSTTSDGGQSTLFVGALAALSNTMEEKKGASVSPYAFLMLMRSLCPQFAERGEQGGYAQQDANECWIELVRRMQSSLAVNMDALQPHIGEPVNGNARSSTGENFNFVKQFMTGAFHCEQRLATESEAQALATAGQEGNSNAGVATSSTVVSTTSPVIVSTEDREETTFTEEFTQLSCYIMKDLKYLESGIRHGLETSLTKHSTKLGRDALYKKTMRISRLPCYLAVQLLRFSYKGNKEISVKILKEVKFPMELDMYEFCTPELKKKLEPMREKLRIHDDRIAEEAKKAKIERSKGNVTESKKDARYACHWLGDDVGASNSGRYQLQAVLTHQGRSSRSGHYVAWVRKSEDTWFKCDDDDVSVVTSESILKLSGGGDWHTAYVLLYGPKLLDLNYA